MAVEFRPGELTPAAARELSLMRQGLELFRKLTVQYPLALLRGVGGFPAAIGLRLGSGGGISAGGLGDLRLLSATVTEFVGVECLANSGAGGGFTVRIQTRPVTLTALELTAVRGPTATATILTVTDDVIGPVLTDVAVTAECVGGVITTTVTETDTTFTVPVLTCGD